MREQCYNAIEQKYGVIKPRYGHWKPKLQKITRHMSPGDNIIDFRFSTIEMWTIKIETTYMGKMEPWEDIKELKRINSCSFNHRDKWSVEIIPDSIF